MDFLKPLFTTTTGRIGRQQWWIGAVVLMVAALVLAFVFGLVGLGPNGASAGWGSLITSLLLLYPSYCLSIKRRQDRNNNGLDLKILMGLSILLSIIQTLGIGITPTDTGTGVVIPTPDMWLSGLLLVMAIFGLYMLVQMGFLKGTNGSNAYGADPLTA